MSDHKIPQTVERFKEQSQRTLEVAREIGAGDPAFVGSRIADLDLHKSSVRALRAMAEHVCVVRLTNGFCRSEFNTDCRCWVEAEGLLGALDSVGVQPVWLYERDGKASPAPERTKADSQALNSIEQPNQSKIPTQPQGEGEQPP